VQLNGWVVSPRLFWCGCLCASGTVEVLKQLDPCSALGIYSPVWINFLGSVGSALLLDSGACALYMYLTVLHTQHLSHVPNQLRDVYLAANLALTFLIILSSLVGSASNNMFWYGIEAWVLIVHQVFNTVLLNVSLSLLTSVLLNMTILMPSANFRAAIRKMRFLRVAIVVLVSGAIADQFVGPSTPITQLVWGVPSGSIDLDDFDITAWVGSMLVCIAHLILLYTLRRPVSKEKESTHTKVERIEVSLQHSVSERERAPTST